MASAVVSPKYQVVIPKEVREQISISPGDEVEVIAKGGLIYIVPVPELSELRGFVKGADLSGFREKSDRI